MDTERKIYGLLETVEQQQKNLNIAAAALEATRAGDRGVDRRGAEGLGRGCKRRRRPGACASGALGYRSCSPRRSRN